MPDFLSKLPRGVRRLFRLPVSRARLLRDANEELQFHFSMRVTELRALGMRQHEAEEEALRRFGDADEFRDYAARRAVRTARTHMVGEWLAEWAQDLRFAIRQIRRAPAFSSIVVLTLALGIGANTAIFSVVHRLLIAPFPFRESNRLAWITMKDAKYNAINLVSGTLFDAWRVRAHSLEAIGAVRGSDVELRDAERVETVTGGAMSAGLLAFLGVHPALGRGFASSDERSGAAPVALLGYEEWQTSFAGRTDVIGTSITLDSVARVIVGVAPAGFVAPFDNGPPKRIWLPLDPHSRALSVIGKLRSGVALDAVNRELTAIAAQVPGERLSPSQSAQALREQDLAHSLRRGILLLFASVGVVLLIACANVANLLLVRAWSRKREFAIRIALGAGRARLIRQWITESLTMAIAGGAGGLAFAWAATRVVVRLRPPYLEVLDRVRLEPAVLGWTMLIALGSGLVFGLAPALFATAHDMTDGLKAGARATDGRRPRLVRSSIIVVEIALSVMLLVGAGLLVRSFRALNAVDLGYTPRGLNAVTVRVGRAVAPPLRRPMIAAFLQRLRQTPGIQGAVLATSVPPNTRPGGVSIQREDRAVSESAQFELASASAVQPSFFNVAGIRIRGRTFSADSTGIDSLPPNEVIINERLARRLWANGNAVGQRIRIGTTVNTVVGVANDIAFPGASGDQVELQWYRPWSHVFGGDAEVVFRSELGEAALDSAVTRAMRSVSPQLAVARKTRSDDELRRMRAPMTFATVLVTGFAVIALCLSVVGLYAVIAFTVSQRTREIGVRVALGAQSRDIVRLVVVNGAALVGAGLLGGITLSAAGSRLLQAYLYGVSERDPFTYAAIVVILGAAALLAGYLPARRAMRVDPTEALRAE